MLPFVGHAPVCAFRNIRLLDNWQPKASSHEEMLKFLQNGI